MTDILLIALCLAVWGSSKVDTHKILKIIGLVMLILGSLLNLDNKPNSLIEYGAILYLVAMLLSAYFRKKNQRDSDRVTS